EIMLRLLNVFDAEPRASGLAGSCAWLDRILPGEVSSVARDALADHVKELVIEHHLHVTAPGQVFLRERLEPRGTTEIYHRSGPKRSEVVALATVVLD